MDVKMMNEFPLKDLTNESFSDEHVIEWDFITDDEINGRWRLYNKQEPCQSSCKGCDMKHGFYFVAVEWAGNNVSDPTWGKETYVNILYRGCAYWDGLRHIYLGSEKTDNYGYMNYPSAKIHIEVWQQLKLLEDKHCRKDL